MRRFAMKMRTRMGLGLSVVMLAGATVWAQRPTSELPKDPPAASSARRGPATFEDFRPTMEQIIREHGSLQVTTRGAIDVRVRVESIEELERAKPILERVLELQTVSFGWINREEELKAELTEALGKVPDALTVNHELRMRDMERKLDRIVKALESPKRDEGQ
jgi:hypothetical protein